MGNLKNFEGSAAIEKIRSLATEENICMFATGLKHLPVDVRPMSTIRVDDQGTLWFMSKADSKKNTDIQENNLVQLFYANKQSAEYLSVFGEASISTDRDLIKELWQPLDKAWFDKGIEDPTITVISVKPLDAYYWDTKSNKLVSLIKIASAALTGKTADVGVEGALAVH